MSKWKKIWRAGPIVKECIYSLPDVQDTDRTRAAKHNATTAAQRALNFKNATQRLEMLLACNFIGRDLFVTLTYDDDHLPATLAQAKRNIQGFIDLLRTQRKRGGQLLKYVYTTEGLHGDHRYHHHLVLNAVGPGDLELICSLWRHGSADVERLADHYFEPVGQYLNYEKLARYLCKEKAEDRPNGAQAWTASRNLEKPSIVSTRVPDDETIETPDGAFEIERQEQKTAYSSFRFIKYVVPGAGRLQPAGPLVRRRKRAG